MNFGVDGTRNLFTSPRKTEVDNKKAKLQNQCIVLLKEDPPRNQWPLCKTIKANPDDQGIVRSVALLLGTDDNNNRERILERPISKLVLILATLTSHLQPSDFSLPLPLL